MLFDISCGRWNWIANVARQHKIVWRDRYILLCDRYPAFSAHNLLLGSCHGIAIAADNTTLPDTIPIYSFLCMHFITVFVWNRCWTTVLVKGFTCSYDYSIFLVSNHSPVLWGSTVFHLQMKQGSQSLHWNAVHNSQTYTHQFASWLLPFYSSGWTLKSVTIIFPHYYAFLGIYRELIVIIKWKRVILQNSWFFYIFCLIKFYNNNNLRRKKVYCLRLGI